MKRLGLVFIALVGLLALNWTTVGAQVDTTCTWLSGLTGDWNVPSNWNCGVVPGPGDTAIINSGTVTLNTNTSVSVVTLTGGTLTGSGTLTVTNSYNWSGGTMDGAGTTVIPAGATLTMSGDFTRVLQRNVDNYGTAVMTGAGSVTMPQAGDTFHNHSGATFLLQGNGSFGSVAVDAVFNNDGTLRKENSSGINHFETILNNYGTVDVLVGTLGIRNGGNATGSFATEGTAVLELQGNWGNYSLQSSSTVSATNVIFSAGTTTIAGDYSAASTKVSAGVADFNTANASLGDITVSSGTLDMGILVVTEAHVTQSGGTLTGSGTLTVTNSYNWSGGTMDGAGTTVIPVGATLTMSGDTCKVLQRNVANYGTAILTGAGCVTIPQAGDTFHNHSGATFLLQSNASFGSVGVDALFINDGTLRKESGSGITHFEPVLNNSSSVEVLVGTLRIRNGGSATGSFVTQGTAVLEFQGSYGNYTLQAGSIISASNAVIFSAGTTAINGSYSAANTTVSAGTADFNTTDATLGDISVSGTLDMGTLEINEAHVTQSGGTLTGSGTLTVTNSYNWSGGTMDGAGTTVIPVGATLTMSGNFCKTLQRDVVNYGTAILTGPSCVTMPQAGDTFHNHSGATFLLQSDASFGSVGVDALFINDGTLRKESGSGANHFEPVFNNSGTVEVLLGTLRLRNGGSATGSFESEGTGAIEFQNHYGNLTLQASSSVSATNVIFSAGTTAVNGSYTAANTTVSFGTTSFGSGVNASSGDLILSGGTLNLNSASVFIGGDFTRTAGTFNAGTSTVVFNGDTNQTLALNLATTFNNLSVLTDTLLVESVAADNATVNGTLTNYGTIRKSKSIGGTGLSTFGLTGARLNVTTQGTLSAIAIDRVGNDHPNANPKMATGQYWDIEPTGAGYIVDLTLPHSVTPDADAMVCRDIGTILWDCARSSSTATTVTRTGITQLSDWAVGDDGVPMADLALSKTVDEAAPPVGEQVLFTVTLTNAGPDNSTGIAVADSQPAGLVFDTVTPSQGNYESGTGIWTVGSLADGATATLTILATINQPGLITNTASLSATDVADYYSPNNQASVTVDGQAADLAVSKSVDNATPTVGELVTFAVSLSNNGPNDTTGVAVTDLLPAGLSYVSDDSGGSYHPATGLWTVGTLANGGSATLNIVATVNQSGALINTASITASDLPDFEPANDTASAAIDALPLISIELTPLNPPIIIPPEGGSYQYQVLITNHSQSVQTFEVWIIIEAPGGASRTLGPATVTLQPGQSLIPTLTQQVPSFAPPGSYTHSAFVGDFPNIVIHSDSFTWEKAATGGQREPVVTDWDSDFEEWQE